VVVNYYLKTKPDAPISVIFLDAKGNEIKTFKSEEAGSEQQAAGSKDTEHSAPSTQHSEKKEPKAPAEAGMNRFVWNMRYPDATNVPGAIFWAGSVDGPIAPPGHYQVRLTVGETMQTVPFEIRKDPRVAATQEDFDAQFDLALKIRDQLTRTHDGINRLRDVRAQVEGWEKRVEGREEASQVRETAAALKKTLVEIEEELIQVRSKALEDPLNFPIKLNNKLASLSGAVASADAAPTKQAYAVYDDLANKIGLHLITLSTVIETDVSEFNQLVSRLSIPAIVPRRE